VARAGGTWLASRFRGEHVSPIQGASLGFALDEDGPGWTLANFEANFGGHNKFWWANSDGSANTTTWDEPSDALLYLGAWAPAQWVGLDQMYVHTWNVIGPSGFAGLPKLDVLDGLAKICATLADTRFPPEEKVDLAATYTGGLIARYRVTADGGLEPLPGTPADDVPWGMAASADGRFLAVTNHGSKKLSLYRIDAEGGLEWITTVDVEDRLMDVVVRWVSAQLLDIPEVALPTRRAFVVQEIDTADERDLTRSVSAPDRFRPCLGERDAGDPVQQVNPHGLDADRQHRARAAERFQRHGRRVEAEGDQGVLKPLHVFRIIGEEDVEVFREPRETVVCDGITAHDHVLNPLRLQ